MNQELLERTIKNRRIELSDQERKDYYHKGLLFTLLFAPTVVLLISVMAKFRGEILDTGFIWFTVLFPVVTIATLCLVCWNKKNALKLHYIHTTLAPKEQQKVLIRLAKENHWRIVECNERQFIANDHCFRWRVRVVVIFGSPHIAYNSRCNPNHYRYHGSGGRNWNNRELIRREIEKE